MDRVQALLARPPARRRNPETVLHAIAGRILTGKLFVRNHKEGIVYKFPIVSRSIVRKGIPAMVKVSSFATRAALATAVTVSVLVARASVPFTPRFGKWTRLSPDPIVFPRGEEFESAGT